MKNKNSIIIIIIILIVMAFIIGNILYLWILPAKHEKECKKRVFKEFQEIEKEVLRGVIGIIPENKKHGLSSYYGIGSGVIFDKKGNTYYVVTAKHVLNYDSNFKIFTKDTEFKGQTIDVSDDINFEIPNEDYYESLLDGKVEYVSSTDDLAILSFQYDKDLMVFEFNSEKINIDDKIMVIGHPEGNRYKITYGYIKSKLETIMLENNKNKLKKRKNKNGIDDKMGSIIEQRVVIHNAYMKHGNSGGVALDKKGKIVGINVGGTFNILGYYHEGYMIPSDIVLNNINNWRKGV